VPGSRAAQAVPGMQGGWGFLGWATLPVIGSRFTVGFDGIG
jgi:hypothetical protein